MSATSLPANAAPSATVWFGTRGSSKGIYRASLDVETGAITDPELAAEIQSPGFLVANQKGDRLYSLGQATGATDSNIAVFSIGEDGTTLTLLDTANTGGGGPTHIALSKDERTLLVAHYGGGSVASLSLDDDGKIAALVSRIDHVGASVNRQRQDKPHPHWIGPTPDDRFVLVPDLGTDEIVVYSRDPNSSELKRHSAGKVPPGSGPRHLKFHPQGKWAYVINEMGLTVTSFQYEKSMGRLTRFQTEVAVAKSELKVPSSGSEIRMHPSGKFLYAGIRGHDVIAVFQIDQKSGQISRVELEPVRGSWPRNFGVDPSGRWLLAAGAESSTVAAFSIDPDSGRLTFSRNLVNVPNPICVEFTATAR